MDEKILSVQQSLNECNWKTRDTEHQKRKSISSPQIVGSAIVQPIFFQETIAELHKCTVNTVAGCDFSQLWPQFSEFFYTWLTLCWIIAAPTTWGWLLVLRRWSLLFSRWIAIYSFFKQQNWCPSFLVTPTNLSSWCWDAGELFCARKVLSAAQTTVKVVHPPAQSYAYL